MSDAAPPPWVKRLEHVNERGCSDSGAWRVHVGLWGWGPFRDNSKAPLAVAPSFYASAATIADKLGMKKAAVAKQLRKLADVGWIKRDADGRIVLAAWGVPGVFSLEGVDVGGTWAAPTLTLGGQGVTPQGQGVPQDPGPTGSPPLTPQDPTPTPQGQGVTPGGHHSSSSSSSFSALGEVRATPGESISPNLAPHVTKAVARAQRSQPAPEVDTRPLAELEAHELAAALAGVSAAAAYSAQNTSTSRTSWLGALREAALAHGLKLADLIEIARAWERTPRSSRPDMGRLWYRKRGGLEWALAQVPGLSSSPMLGCVDTSAEARAEEIEATTYRPKLRVAGGKS